MALVKYFAYGSNMASKRLQARVPSARVCSRAFLPEHVLKFHKTGTDGSAKCDAYETGNPVDILYGVLYEIDEGEKVILDRAEGLGRGYEIKTVTVRTPDDGLVQAFTYYATNIQEGMRPFDWYKAFVLQGAQENGLPQDHVDMIERQECTKDKNRLRAALNFSILQS